jgi:hypothetical protein
MAAVAKDLSQRRRPGQLAQLEHRRQVVGRADGIVRGGRR